MTSLVGCPVRSLSFVFFWVLLIAIGVAVAGPSQAQGLDVNAVMPCAPPAHSGKQAPDVCEQSRGLFMQNCTSCHTVIPVVRMQKPDAEWDATLVRHREKMSEAEDADLDLIKQFLKDHFRPDRPQPNVPQELIDSDPGFPAA